jgi:hypothetical protein
MSQPHQLTTTQLLALGSHAVDQLARSALGTLTSYRLLLGRCLLAIERSQSYLEFGCSSAVHYAVSQLGLSAQNARATLRVTRQLEDLPLLTLAAEEGWLPWSKLREVVRIATPETESHWLEMCKKLNYHQLETLVSRSASPNSQEPISSQLRLQLAPEALQVLQQTMQIISQQTGRALSPAQALEMLCADYLARHAPLDPPNDNSAVECSARNIWNAATACQEVPCPNNDQLHLVEPAPAHWENPRLRYNPESRLATSAQRAQLIRRDDYRCKTPGCPHHLFLQVHHIKFYAHRD